MTKQDVKQFTTRLKQQVKENPILAICVAGALLTAVNGLINASTQRSYAKTHAKEVDRRIAKSYSN
jgi:protein tyrosine phosphatase (PTP) superfamily phosphohydrolase (DUF442 family)